MSSLGICFDLDGTLLDTLEDIADSCNRVFASLDFPPYPVDRYRDFIGEGVVRLFEKALPAGSDAAQVSKCVERFRVEYDAGWDRKSGPFAGIVELIDELDQRQAKLAVLSNKPHAFTVKCVDRFFDPGTFAPVFGQREGIPRKPDPAAALDIARQVNVEPSAWFYVGDSVVDMQTAQAAGMQAIAVNWGYQDGALLVEHGAQELLEHPRDLLRLLPA